MALSLDEEQAPRLWRMFKKHIGTFVRLSEQGAPNSVAEPTE
jgi:hypothetical protein